MKTDDFASLSDGAAASVGGVDSSAAAATAIVGATGASRASAASAATVGTRSEAGCDSAGATMTGAGASLAGAASTRAMAVSLLIFTRFARPRLLSAGPSNTSAFFGPLRPEDLPASDFL